MTFFVFMQLIVLFIALLNMGRAYRLMSQPREAQYTLMRAARVVEGCQEHERRGMMAEYFKGE